MAFFENSLDALIDAETERRQRFYSETDEVKAEFINGEIFIHPPSKFEENNAVGSP